MHVIIFSWEYPPRVIGKLSDYVKTLSEQLAAKNLKVDVVTFHDTLTGLVKEPNGVEQHECQIPFEHTLEF